MKSDILLTTRRHHVSQNLNEWLLCDLYERGYVSCHRAIRIVVGYTLSVTLFSIAASHYVIKTEPHPFYTTVGHLNIGSVGRLILNDGPLCSQCNLTVTMGHLNVGSVGRLVPNVTVITSQQTASRRGLDLKVSLTLCNIQ